MSVPVSRLILCYSFALSAKRWFGGFSMSSCVTRNSCEADYTGDYVAINAQSPVSMTACHRPPSGTIGIADTYHILSILYSVFIQCNGCSLEAFNCAEKAFRWINVELGLICETVAQVRVSCFRMFPILHLKQLGLYS